MAPFQQELLSSLWPPDQRAAQEDLASQARGGHDISAEHTTTRWARRNVLLYAITGVATLTIAAIFLANTRDRPVHAAARRWRSIHIRQGQDLRLLAASSPLSAHGADSSTCTEPHLNGTAIERQPGSDTCITLNWACLDQGTVVSFDPAFSPESPAHQKLPEFDITDLMYNWPTEKGNGDALGEGAARLTYPPLVIRAGTYLDTHLTAQPFSKCTAPLVWFTNWLTTYGEAVVRIPQRAYIWAEKGLIDKDVTFVIGTPGGLGLSNYWAAMLAPFTDLAVSSLADFSARVPPGTPSPATNEGTHQQCFAKVVLCKIPQSEFGSMYDAGQATFTHYATATEVPLPQDPAGFFKQGGLAAVQQSPEAGAGPLRVLIEQRRGVVRSFLQLEELLSSCNGAADRQQRYACRSYVFSDDYRRNVAAARSANVLVTIHGSGSNNALLMEEGSALIEVRPYEFGTRAHAWANFFMPKVAEQNGYRVLYFGLNTQDPTLSQPGGFEANHTGYQDESTHRRDRHVLLRWDLLRKVLDTILSLHSNQTSYLELVARGEHILNVLPGNVLEPWISPEQEAATAAAIPAATELAGFAVESPSA